jgi:hypothetical protein
MRRPRQTLARCPVRSAVATVALASLMAGACAAPPGPDRWSADVDRLHSEVLPIVQALDVSRYLVASPCRILEYPRGTFRDGDVSCKDVVRFDSKAREDFEQITDAIERSGVTVERIVRQDGAIHVRVPESSVQYNWAYVYGPDPATPPRAAGPDEQWTHIRGRWWFRREHDD